MERLLSNRHFSCDQNKTSGFYSKSTNMKAEGKYTFAVMIILEEGPTEALGKIPGANFILVV